jgi:curved DNA-binding protein CbpA
MVDYYNLLQVAPEAAPEAIRAAYRREAKRWHPDAHPHLESAEREAVERRFILVSQAYDTLSDPARRRDYDRGRAAARPSASSPRPSAHGTASEAGTGASRPRAKQAGPRAQQGKPRGGASPEPDWSSLLSEVENLLGKFGLDLKQPAERLLETLLGWARALYEDFRAAWHEEGPSSTRGAKPDFSKPGASSRGPAAGRPAPSRSAGHDKTRTPEIEAELAELKHRAKEKNSPGSSKG